MAIGEFVETPSICASNYGSTTGDMMGNLGQAQQWKSDASEINALAELLRPHQPKCTEETVMANPVTRRIVQVFIADPNENVPLDHSVLYKGEQKLTDLNDNELFFEIPMAETLKAHNEKRVKWLDKEASKLAGKDILLDPAKIRDLKMLVVTIAAF